MNVTLRGRSRHFRTVTFEAARNSVRLIEQRRLPHEFKIVATRDFRETAAAIRQMVVRGAGAIGATAAYGLAQGARAFRGDNLNKFSAHVETVFQTLKSARPTAVDPVNAMNEVRSDMARGQTVVDQQALALAAAEEFANQDVRQCEAIGRHGEKLIRSGARILTHCNAGWLAFVDIGTATAPMYAAQAAGKKIHVWCDETRPRSQGATLTAWELAQQKIPHQIIADNAAGHLMQRGKIDLIIVGSDRTLGRTGEVANKIGTYTKAVLAARHRIPFYVAIPLSTIDWNLKSGFDIPIEERAESEVLGAWGVPEGREKRERGRTPGGRRKSLEPVYVRVANSTSGACNPGFDVTPPGLITAIITPLGIIKPRELWERRHELGFRRNRYNIKG
ncbi:MAG TPA: S-methyl-5-thioribose-1-phosphate isomerase [Verrucomicrobiae bacterium]|nr:S-methyl-5-thioribose-1-phosphate isomerase [Verrucomicrobiae bacterium]